MIPIVAGIVSMLANKGMNILSNAIDGGADKVIDMVAEKTGIELSADKELSTEELVKLQEFERVHESELLKYHTENTKSARDMQKTALAQEDVFSKRYVYYLATFWSAVAVIYIFMITFMNIPADNIRFADTVLGFLLGTIVATIINFFFGSSKGSKDKHDILHAMKGK